MALVERTGFCKGCGYNCCTAVSVPMTAKMMRDRAEGKPVHAPVGDADYLNWLKLHGLGAEFEVPANAEVRFAGGYIWLWFDKRCSQLTDDNKCALFGMPERPHTCEIWPQRPWEIELMGSPGKEECGYRFDIKKG